MNNYKIRKVDFNTPNISIDFSIWANGDVSRHEHAYHEIFVVCDDEINYTLNGKNLKLYKGTISFVKKMPSPPIWASSILFGRSGLFSKRGLNSNPLSINSIVNVGVIYSTLTIMNSVFE